MVELRAIYVLWLREMKKLSRSKERIFGSIGMPIMFLAFLGFGFNKAAIPGLPSNVPYINFLVPGMIGMNMLFGSMFAGISVLWDREFGFLKEIMVAPVSRLSIAIGRIAGGATTGLIQGVLIFFISFIFGFRLVGIAPSLPLILSYILSFVLMLVFMVLAAVCFVSVGLIFASNMRDAQGFDMIINFVMFPLFLLSGALSPIANFPMWLKIIAFLNPLTFAVDGVRGSLIGFSTFHVSLDLFVMCGYALLLLSLASYFFEKSEGV